MGNLCFNLQNRVAVVTGGTRGIGLEVAKALLGEGAKVSICARKQEGLDQARSVLNASDNLLTVQGHIGKEEDVDKIFDKTLQTFGEIDFLINNVGMNIMTSVVDASLSLWQKIIDTNLTGSFLCSKKAAKIMMSHKKGKIINISSIAGTRAAPVMGVYGIAKAGVDMMTKVLASELAPFNICVNAIAPSMVKTAFSEPFWSNKDLHSQIIKGIPLGRIAEPLDVSMCVLFLCSDASNFITGTTIKLDGGASAI
ncbi:MAG: SDR family oxidoreductase [Desulfobacterales bacterium]|nr:SDR family oxidoreductase [Desulfobacterales bacterium]